MILQSLLSLHFQLQMLHSLNSNPQSCRMSFSFSSSSRFPTMPFCLECSPSWLRSHLLVSALDVWRKYYIMVCYCVFSDIMFVASLRLWLECFNQKKKSTNATNWRFSFSLGEQIINNGSHDTTAFTNCNTWPGHRAPVYSLPTTSACPSNSPHFASTTFSKIHIWSHHSSA